MSAEAPATEAPKVAPAAETPKVNTALLGRLGTNLQIGIVGLPNVGKSSFFNVCSHCSVPAENYPFCTIKPNTAVVPVPDERFDWLVGHWKPASAVSAFLQITDIAGLVKGASEGQGLGNAFLSNIKSVDAIYQMVRVFDDEEVVHVDGNVDPVRDIETIAQELRLKDISWLEENLAAMEKAARTKKEKKEELEIVQKCLDSLKKGIDIRWVEWSAKEAEIVAELLLLTAKPVIYLLNMSEKDYLKKSNKFLKQIVQFIKSHGNEPLIPFSVSFEEKIAGMSPEEREKYCKENNTKSMLPKIVTTGYEMLDLIHYFTSGSDEVKCWTIRRGTKAPQAAGRIHTDFEATFICCDVIKFSDMKQFGSEPAVKNAGKYLQQGKTYEVEDGDIILFHSGAGKKKKK